jgi:transcriptional regulator with XRE-family HTH domain
MALSDNIKKIRKLKKYTVADLAAEMKINVQSIYAWERGEYDPTKENLESMAGILEVPVKAFYDENLTEVDKLTDNTENNGPGDELYRKWLEGQTDYRLIHKTLLDGEYRMMLKSEIDSREKMLWQVIESKNYAIAQLEKEIAELRSGQRAAVHPQKA